MKRLTLKCHPQCVNKGQMELQECQSADLIADAILIIIIWGSLKLGGGLANLQRKNPAKQEASSLKSEV